MRKWFFIVFLAVACPAFGQADAVIVAPDEVQPGDLVILDSEGSTGTAFGWRLVNSEKNFLVFDGKCVFASGTPGDYIFVLGVHEEDAAGVTGDMAVHTIRVLGKVPKPVDPVDPVEPDDPQPPPNPRPNLSGVEGDIFAVLDRSSADTGQVLQIADNINSVLGQAAGLGWDPNQMNTELSKLNREKVFNDPDAVKAWGNDWATVFIDAMKPVPKTDKAGTMEKLAEIETGMREYAKWQNKNAARSFGSAVSPIPKDAANASLADVLRGMKGQVNQLKGELQTIRREVGE